MFDTASEFVTCHSLAKDNSFVNPVNRPLLLFEIACAGSKSGPREMIAHGRRNDTLSESKTSQNSMKGGCWRQDD